MGRRLTTPKDAKGVFAKLPASLQIGIHQLALERWKATGRKPSQNELFIEAVQQFLTNQSVDMSQIEEATEKWSPKRNHAGTITRFPKGKRR